MSVADTGMVRVWDPLVRIFHWTLVIAFAVAYFTEDDLLTVHVWAGYVVGALIVLRLIWGFVGPRHARFSDFLYRPATILRYVRDLLLFRAPRYIGHSPGGGAMVIVLMLVLAATGISGLILYGAKEHAGPLAGFFIADAAAPGRPAGPPATIGMPIGASPASPVATRRRPRSAFVRTVEEIHELLANFALALVILHIGAVVLASFVHRENLARAMVTGEKRA